jgi:hypothetical protein
MPEVSTWGQVECTLLVNGRDVVGDVFDHGPKTDPDDLLGRHGSLWPADEPRRVRLAVAECAEGCCGAAWVGVRRDGDEVVWDGWENTGNLMVPDEVRFGAEPYAAELARADADRGWEWPGRTVARILRGGLQDEPAVLARWNRRLDWVVCRPGERNLIVLSVVKPDDARAQSIVRFPVTDEPVVVQADRALDRLRRHPPW